MQAAWEADKAAVGTVGQIEIDVLIRTAWCLGYHSGQIEATRAAMRAIEAVLVITDDDAA